MMDSSVATKRFSRRMDSMAPSLITQDMMEVMYPESASVTLSCQFASELCRPQNLTATGKRFRLFKILSLTLLPILGLWAFTVYSLSDGNKGKADLEQTQYAVQFSVEVGKFLDRIQRERDMSVLYLSILGPETKTFLMNEYLLTDQAVDRLSDWPENNEFSGIFRSKSTFKKFLKEHRSQLDPSNYDIYVEMDFYNFLIGRFVEWMYGAIKESNRASIWKILVAYQKIVTSMEHVGIERSLGTVFYVEGRFPDQRIFEWYNSRVNNFKANYRSAVLYSHIVDPIFQEGVTASGTNLTAVIEKFRTEIQSTMRTTPSIERGQWWFDNMTLYLDKLLIIQQDLASLINGELQDIIDAEEKNLTISACFLVVVFLMCPLVIYTVEALTSKIHKYALALVHKTKELTWERRRRDSLQHHLVPRKVIQALAVRTDEEAEYFKAVTVVFAGIEGLDQTCLTLPPSDVVSLLECLHEAIDLLVEKHEVYKVDTVNGCAMFAAGVPKRVGNRHSAVAANIALSLLKTAKEKTADPAIGDRPLQMRIGMHSGSCVAGIVGTSRPRYRLLGDTIVIASRIFACGEGDRIHVSRATWRSLQKHSVYSLVERGAIPITWGTQRFASKAEPRQMGGARMTTYWLTGRCDGGGTHPGALDPDERDDMAEVGEMPGEILPSSNHTLHRHLYGPTHSRVEAGQDKVEGEDVSQESSFAINSLYDTPASTTLPFTLVQRVQCTEVSAQGQGHATKLDPVPEAQSDKVTAPVAPSSDSEHPACSSHQLKGRNRTLTSDHKVKSCEGSEY